MSLVSLDALPKHVAIIMDGNGRWAQRLGKPRTSGHREGSRAVRRTVTACRRLGIKVLTLYAFSEQNWQRPPSEVRALMSLFREFLISEREEVLRTGIRVRAIGRVSRLPGFVRDLLGRLVADTESLDAMTLQLAISYGGQEEIVDSVRRLASLAAKGEIDPEAIDEKSFGGQLPSVQYGPVDLLIRTGGEYRISNFLLWGSAYAEFFFSQTLWPDFGEQDLYQAIASFQSRQRRYGRVPRAEEQTGIQHPDERPSTPAQI